MPRYFNWFDNLDNDDNVDNVEVHWSEDDMTLALESVKTGNMSINQVRNVESQPAHSDLSGFSISDKQVRAGRARSKNKRELLWFLVMKIKTTI